MSKISVCIPTYDRHDSLREIINDFIDSKAYEVASLIILDDCPEAKNEDLNDNRQNIFYLKNITNIGYASSFLKLFEISDAEYLFFSSDDDKINFQGLKDFVNKELDLTDFACISTTFTKNDHVYRGKKYSTIITQGEIRSASNHAPGLIYNKESVFNYINLLKLKVEEDCYFTKTYPQVALFFLCFFDNKKLIWSPAKIVSSGFEFDSKIKDKNGYSYFHPVSRVNEFKSVSYFFRSLLGQESWRDKKILWSLIKHKMSFHKFIIAPYLQTERSKFFGVFKGIVFYLKCFLYAAFNYLTIIFYALNYFLKTNA